MWIDKKYCLPKAHGKPWCYDWEREQVLVCPHCFHLGDDCDEIDETEDEESEFFLSEKEKRPREAGGSTNGSISDFFEISGTYREALG